MAQRVINPKYQVGWGDFLKNIREMREAQLKNPERPSSFLDVLKKLDERRRQEMAQAKENTDETVDTPVEDVETVGEPAEELPVIDDAAEPLTDAEDESVEVVDESEDETENLCEFSSADKPEAENESALIVEESVTTFREAQAFMKEKFGLTHNDVISREKLQEQMTLHNVQFPNLTL